jgi:hypothetical protein
MLFIFSTPVLIRHLWLLKTVVFLHWCQIPAVKPSTIFVNKSVPKWSPILHSNPYRRERLSKVDLQSRWAALRIQILFFNKTSYGNYEVNCTEPSPSVSFTWLSSSLAYKCYVRPKGFPRTNTPAYLPGALVTEKTFLRQSHLVILKILSTSESFSPKLLLRNRKGPHILSLISFARMTTA